MGVELNLFICCFIFIFLNFFFWFKFLLWFSIYFSWKFDHFHRKILIEKKKKGVIGCKVVKRGALDDKPMQKRDYWHAHDIYWLMGVPPSKNLSQNQQGYLKNKNQWTNTRLVCTHLNEFSCWVQKWQWNILISLFFF